MRWFREFLLYSLVIITFGLDVLSSFYLSFTLHCSRYISISSPSVMAKSTRKKQYSLDRAFSFITDEYFSFILFLAECFPADIFSMDMGQFFSFSVIVFKGDCACFLWADNCEFLWQYEFGLNSCFHDSSKVMIARLCLGLVPYAVSFPIVCHLWQDYPILLQLGKKTYDELFKINLHLLA